MEDDQVAQLFSDLRGGAITRHPALAMLDEMWALRDNVTMFDAWYVTLAARLRLPLVTADRRLAAASRLPCEVETY